MKFSEQMRGAALILGAGLIAMGVAMIYVPAGLIASGVILIVGGILDSYDDETSDGGDGRR